MLTFKPHSYQEHAIKHIITNWHSALFLDMGLGKTAITLTAINYLMYEDFHIEKVLIIAPKRVAETTWPAEVNKWSHLKHLTVSLVLGSEKERIKALNNHADIYVVNRENVPWLTTHYENKLPFDMLVIDELSSFKSHNALRFKALRKVRPGLKRIVGLTGTPAPNSLLDLWPQLYLLDQGKRLEPTITGYRNKYFTPGRTNGQIVFDYKLKKGSRQAIQQQISDICISMQTKDYLQLPKRLYKTIDVYLSPKELKRYKAFEKEQILALGLNKDITAVNAAALTNKLSQFANGAIYDENKQVHELHTAKLEALGEVIEEAQGKNILLFYNYKHDLQRIQKAFKHLNPVKLESEKDIAHWQQGKIKLLLAHPASAGHGLNLQTGGDVIVWFAPTWSLELYEQANARLYRQGRHKPVTIIHLIAKDTIDEIIMQAITDKESGQRKLLKAVKAIVDNA